MSEFLTTVSFMEERVNAGIDVHVSDLEAQEFQKLAKIIDPQRHFTIYGCQSCINTLVKFVFDYTAKQGKIIKKESFPKAKDNGKE